MTSREVHADVAGSTATGGGRSVNLLVRRMRGVLHPIEHSFGASIAVDEVETLLAQVPPEDDAGCAWCLDLSEVGNVQPGAGYRLGNALRRWSSGELVVRVPPPGDFSGSWFQTFTRSGIGLALATYATEIVAERRDLTDDVRRYYAANADASATNYAARTGLELGGLTPDIDRFAGELRDLATSVRLVAAGLGPDSVRALAELLFEAVRNVEDHAYAGPWTGTGPPPLSYLALRHYEGRTAKRGERAGLHEYLARARSAAQEDGQEIVSWVEIVVADDGVGIAARQHGTTDVYGGAPELEERALREALRSRESIKLVTRDAVTVGEPGYGYALIRDALVRLRAHASLRTGRTLAELDGSSPDALGFRLRDDTFGWMPGTVLQVVLPLRDPQLRIPT